MSAGDVQMMTCRACPASVVGEAYGELAPDLSIVCRRRAPIWKKGAPDSKGKATHSMSSWTPGCGTRHYLCPACGLRNALLEPGGIGGMAACLCGGRWAPPSVHEAEPAKTTNPTAPERTGDALREERAGDAP